MRLMNSSRTRLFLIYLAVFAVLGCQEAPKPKRIPTYPVHGTLRIDGAPAVGASVKFYAADKGGRMPAAIVREDGAFSASFYATEDGAPAGEYRLLVLWMVPPPAGGLPVDRLQGRFTDPSRPVRIVTIVAGENHLPAIEISSATSPTR